MVEKFCNFILAKMRKRMPDITDEKAEAIEYGLELMVGEMPKTIFIFILGFVLGIGWYIIFLYFALLPYRMMTGGFHLHTHLGCIIGSCTFYYGNIFLSKFLVLYNVQKYVLIVLTLIFGIMMVSLYAPADTENVPIINKKERKQKKILSYITLAITLGVASLIQNSILSNILIIGVILQTFTITRLAYKLTNNKYGYEEYTKQQVEN